MRPVRTLRGRLVLLLAGLSLAGLLLMAMVSVALLERSLVDRIDERLAELSQPWSQGGPPPLPPPPGRSQGQSVPTDYRVLIFNPYGTRIGMLGSAGSNDSGPDLEGSLEERVTTVSDTEGGDDWRVRITRMPDGTTVALAQSLSGVTATVNQLITIEVVVGGLVLIVLGAAAAVTVRMSLRPLARIEHTADAIAAGNLGRRVPDTDPRVETGRLGAAINTMLSRLVDALQQREASEYRLRRFVADASHELRTPLTSIRGFAELYRRSDNPNETEVASMMGRIESEGARMGRLVDDLLLLARLDRERAIDVVELDLVPLLREVVHDAQARDPDRTVTLDVRSEPMRVLGDGTRLRQVITNLVSNALVHATQKTPVTVAAEYSTVDGAAIAGAGAEVERGTRAVVVSVADRGPGIPADHARRIFDRFYRVESGRTSDGAGLGLAISSALAEAHDGRIELRSNSDGGSTFSLLLPLTSRHRAGTAS